MELLLDHGVATGDALLYAIRKEVVGAVELLLSHRRPSGEKQVCVCVRRVCVCVRRVCVCVRSVFSAAVTPTAQQRETGVCVCVWGGSVCERMCVFVCVHVSRERVFLLPCGNKQIGVLCLAMCVCR